MTDMIRNNDCLDKGYGLIGQGIATGVIRVMG